MMGSDLPLRGPEDEIMELLFEQIAPERQEIWPRERSCLPGDWLNTMWRARSEKMYRW